MSEVREVAVGRGVVAWDGRVVETFGYEQVSRRMHARLIESIEYSDGRILGPMLTFTVSGSGPVSIDIGNDPAQRAELDALLAEVQQRRTA